MDFTHQFNFSKDSLASTQKTILGVLVSTKTDPSFQIWLFPSSHDDTIFNKMKDTGAYKSEKTVFIKTIFLDGKCGWAVNNGANIDFHSLHIHGSTGEKMDLIRIVLLVWLCMYM